MPFQRFERARTMMRLLGLLSVVSFISTTGYGQSAIEFGATEHGRPPVSVTITDSSGDSWEAMPVFVARDALGDIVAIDHATSSSSTQSTESSGTSRGARVSGSLGWNNTTGLFVSAALLVGPTNSAAVKGVLIEGELGTSGWQAGAGGGIAGLCDRFNSKCRILLGLVVTVLDRDLANTDERARYTGLRFLGAYDWVQVSLGVARRLNRIDDPIRESSLAKWRWEFGVSLALNRFIRRF